RAEPTRVRIGVIGAGLIAQVMHLHYLSELSDRFEVSAICDIAPENAAASAARYGVQTTCTDWRVLLREPIDAVLVLTGGSHAPTTLESPIAPYVGHYPLSAVQQPPEELVERLRTEAAVSITTALGDVDPVLRRIYHSVLLDTLVHELNAVRGLFGEPDRLEHADL